MHLQTGSTQRLKWQFDELAPGKELFINEAFGDYQQQARLLVPDFERTAPVFVLGGARSDFTRLNPLLYRLQAAGIGSLTGNLSGHSLASEPGAVSPSLATNLDEARRFHTHIAQRCRTIVGHSLGAAITLKLAAQLPQVDSIVLICPAVYPDQAHPLPFGPAFTAAIKKTYGFLDCDSYAFLKQFQGRVMIVIGEYDGLNSQRFAKNSGTSAGSLWLAGAERYSPIPEEVTQALMQSVSAARLQCLFLADCDHGIAAHLRSNPAIADLVASAVEAFILNDA